MSTASHLTLEETSQPSFETGSRNSNKLPPGEEAVHSMLESCRGCFYCPTLLLSPVYCLAVFGLGLHRAVYSFGERNCQGSLYAGTKTRTYT
jgi:hypothetical protein